MPTAADHDDAARIATAAGELLLQIRAEAFTNGTEAKVLKDEGDRRANDLILALLAESHPDDAILSEESADTSARLTAHRVWIVDPLDGTREFGEEGRTDWAVHVALLEGGALVAGAVALPAMGRTFHTGPGGIPEVPPAPSTPRLVVSRTRPPAVTAVLQEALSADLVPMGSAGAKTMSLILGESDIYAHGGGQYEWDSAAPVAVAAAAGLHVSRLDGSPLVYNNENPYLPDLLVCRPEAAAEVIRIVRESVAGTT